MNNTLNTPNIRPWYQHRWPWLLMLGPAIAAVGCIVTIWLAQTHQDSPISQQYYKQGLVISKDIRRQEKAEQFKITAQINYVIGKPIKIRLEGFSFPPNLILKVSHPTLNNYDQIYTLTKQADGRTYLSSENVPYGTNAKVNWYFQIESPEWLLSKKENLTVIANEE